MRRPAFKRAKATPPPRFHDMTKTADRIANEGHDEIVETRDHNLPVDRLDKKVQVEDLEKPVRAYLLRNISDFTRPVAAEHPGLKGIGDLHALMVAIRGHEKGLHRRGRSRTHER